MRGFGEYLMDGNDRETQRERRGRIYRSESAWWASDRKHINFAVFKQKKQKQNLRFSYVLREGMLRSRVANKQYIF